MFSVKVLSRNDNVNWLPKLCNMTLLVFFIKVSQKQVYKNISQTTEKLKENIQPIIEEIEQL